MKNIVRVGENVKHILEELFVSSFLHHPILEER